ncbi:MAG: nicotinate (nicotinamide) nucleotide adenylyltransferase [Leptospiraceae bacterium]|nr:nicotinate (nicotinamide) nucleotide adenylyltransferase [Leptospiraceae bacterium]MDW8305887.1 nicotinate (nicotinamide) nucleotide adenylyltransferase [Leptospiraceae bacterium]
MKLFLYGGSFNPPHLGHRRLVEYVVQKENPELLIIIPAAQNPLKEELLPFKKRFSLLRLLFEGALSSKIRLTRLENHLSQPSYTINTICKLRSCFPHAQIYFILGMDSFLTLPQWHRWQELSKLVHFYVLQRGEKITDIPSDFGDVSYTIAQNPLWEISASLLRNWLHDYYLAEEHRDHYLQGWIASLLKEKLSEKVFAEIVRNKYYYPQELRLRP